MTLTGGGTNRGRGIRYLRVGRSLRDDEFWDDPEIDENETVWDIYQKYTWKVDNENIRDWNDTLSTLLVFAALYSAVLTAFIIESLTLIQEDTSESARDILLHISIQLANISSPPFNATSSPFIAPQWALSVNYCFFISLCFSLITALAAVLALQWVGSYDRALNPSSVEQCSSQRQFRREGAAYWGLEDIIASLPTLIFISLLIFFVGLAIWMWNVHHNVSIIVIVSTAIGFLFYFTTTLISIYSARAPFRTPAARYLTGLLRVTLGGAPISIKIFHDAYSSIRTCFTTNNANLAFFLRRFLTRLTSRQFWSWFSIRKFLESIRAIFTPLITFRSFESRELEVLKGIPEIKLTSLFWLSRIISTEASQRQSFVKILKAIFETPQGKVSKDQIDSNLWERIFMVLISSRDKKLSWNNYSQEELDDAVLTMKGLTSIRMGMWKEKDFKSLVGKLYRYTDPRAMADVLLSWQRLHLQRTEREEQKRITQLKEGVAPSDSYAGVDDPSTLEDSGLVLERQEDLPEDQIKHLRETIQNSYEYALNNWQSSPPEFLFVVLEKINAIYPEMDTDERESILPASAIFQKITENLSIDPSRITTANTVSLQILDMLQNLITKNLERCPLTATTSEPYLYLMHFHYEERHERQVIDTYGAMIQQRIARLSQMPTLSLSNDEDLSIMLSGILRMAQSPLWTHISESWITPILVSMAEIGSRIWVKENRVNSAHLIALALHFEWEPSGENWSKWWVEFILGFANLIESGSYESAETLFIRHGSSLLSSDLPGPDSLPDPEINRLKKISHIGVRLFVMTVTKSVELARSVLVEGFNKSSKDFWTPNETWIALIDRCYTQFEKQAVFVEEIFRALAIGSSLKVYDRIYRDNTVKYKSTTDLYQHLRSPVLPAILRHSSGREIRTWRILITVCGHESFSSEFVSINGLEWLHQFVAERPFRFKEAISFIYKSTAKYNSYEDSKAWVVASRECAKSAVAAIREGKIIARELWQSISHNARLLIDQFEKKLDEIPKPPSQRKADQMDTEGNLEGATKKDNALNSREVTLKGPIIKDWTQEDRQDFKILIDKFTQEIYEVLGHAMDKSSWWDISMASPSDLSLLRRLTMSRPLMWSHLIRYSDRDIPSDSSIAFSHFRAPVLEMILRKGETYDIMKMMASISCHSWFKDEFICAKGHEIVPQILRPVYLEEAIEVVNNQFPFATDPSSILLWVTLTRDCLKSVGQAISEISSSEDMEKEYGDMINFARTNLSTLVRMISDSMNKWRDERMQPQTSTESTSGKSKRNQGKHSNKDAVQWSPVEWSQISTLIEEIIPGLQRGYIAPTLSERYTRFPYDPEGLCLHTPSFIPENISAKIRLLGELGSLLPDANGDEKEEEKEDGYDDDNKEEEGDGSDDDDEKEGDANSKWW